MNEAAAEARRAYKRAWAKANPDKIRAQQERYWTKRAERAELLKEIPAVSTATEDINNEIPEPVDSINRRRYIIRNSNER